MDYLELENDAVEALTELGGGFDFNFPAPAPAHTVPKTNATTRQKARPRNLTSKYLLRLEDPFATPRDVANTLSLPRVPEAKTGYGEMGETKFCILSQSDVEVLDVWAEEYYPHRKFTKIPLNRMAHKDAELPFLGRDATLPHHRPSTHPKPHSDHDEFPVKYFFYGTLADPLLLSRLFGVQESEILPLRPAVLLDGMIRMWANKYRALIDAPGKNIHGQVYEVTSATQEDALREYEGRNYEVVEARTMLAGEETLVRVFRFAGLEDELSDC